VLSMRSHDAGAVVGCLRGDDGRKAAASDHVQYPFTYHDFRRSMCFFMYSCMIDGRKRHATSFVAMQRTIIFISKCQFLCYQFEA
jgi:hypothetical protein